MRVVRLHWSDRAYDRCNECALLLQGENCVVSHENIRAKIEKDEGHCLRSPDPLLKIRLREEISKVGIMV